MSRRICWLFAAAFTLTAARAHAQTRTSVALDATIGGATGKGGEFYDREMPGARFAVSVRRAQTSHVGVFAEAAMDFVSLTTGHNLSCRPSPRGGCLDPYPEFFGPTAVVGITRERADRRMEARLGVGGGTYRGDGTSVGAVVSQADVAWLPAKHVGIVLGTRWIVVPRFRHDRLWMMPWSFGLRVR